MKIPILAYHAVAPLPAEARVPGTVPLAVFEEQVRGLVQGGYTGIDLDHAADLLDGRGERVSRPVVITFDDGYRSVLEHAWPVLRDAGLPATLFVVTGHVGRTTCYDEHKGGVPQEHADWAELERAAVQGLELGSHGETHRPLGELAPDEAAQELARSRELLATRFGRCDHFAYPFGDLPADADEQLARADYRTGCTTRPGFNRRGSALPRLRRQVLGRRSGIGRWRHLRLRRKLGRWW